MSLFLVPHQNEIIFNIETPNFVFDVKDNLSKWIKKTIESEGGSLNFINFIFCSDEYLYKINVEHLNHDYYTDVITFHYNENYIEGDVFVSVERTTANALELGIPPEKELYRVIIHGVLHLLGYGDKTPEDKKLMTSKEDEYLAILYQKYL